LTLRHAEEFVHFVSDAAFNDFMARASLTGDWTYPEQDNAFRFKDLPYPKAPGYLWFLGCIYRVTSWMQLADPASDNFLLWPRVVQMMLGLGSCILTFQIGRRTWGATSGLLAAAGMATYWLLIYYEGSLHSPSLEAFLILLMLTMLSRLRERPTLALAVAGGLVLGFLIVTRKNVLVFLPLALFWLGYARDQVRWKSVSQALLVLAGVCAMIAPATWRNWRASGAPVLVSCDVGRNLYIANNPAADGLHPVIPEQTELTGTSGWSIFLYPDMVDGLGRRLGYQLTCAEAETWFAQQAWVYARENTHRVMSLLGRKLVAFCSPIEISSDQVPEYDRRAAPVLKRLPGNFAWILGPALVGGLVTVLRFRSFSPSQRRELGLLALFALAYVVSFLPGIAESRYRVGLLPLLLLSAGYAWTQLAESARQGKWTTLVMLAGALALALVVTSRNWLGYQPDLAKWYYERGVVARLAGDHAIAAERFLAAAGVRPDFVEAHHNAALALAESGQVATAETEFYQALLLRPDHRDVYLNLAHFLASTARLEEAMDVAAAAISRFPRDAALYLGVGRLVTDEGHFAGALPYVERALTLEPENSEAHALAGVILARLLRQQEARESMLRAVMLAPGNPKYTSLLAEIENGPPPQGIVPVQE